MESSSSRKHGPVQDFTISSQLYTCGNIARADNGFVVVPGCSPQQPQEESYETAEENAHGDAPETSVDRNKIRRREQKYFCDSCPVSFTRRSTLVRHKRSSRAHRPESDITCPHCPKTLTRLHDLRRHVQKKHPEHSANNHTNVGSSSTGHAIAGIDRAADEAADGATDAYSPQLLNDSISFGWRDIVPFDVPLGQPYWDDEFATISETQNQFTQSYERQQEFDRYSTMQDYHGMFMNS